MMRYSDMNEIELVKETERLRREAKRKVNEGKFHEVNVLEQKYYFAKSYLMNPEDIEPGTVYHVHGEAGIFKVHFVRGVMAWGYVNNQHPEVAFPIGRLYRPDWSDKGGLQ
mgnify:CR=1 FL=1